MGPPLDISVVIPTCNNPSRLSVCLHGLLRQTFHAFEIIVINDGGDEDILWRFIPLGLHQSPSFLLKSLNPPSTAFRAGQARNLGLKYARGGRTLFVDEDCILAPDVLARHAAYPLTHVVEGARHHVPGNRDYTAVDVAEIARFRCDTDERARMPWSVYRDAAQRLRRGERQFPINYRLCWSFQLSVPTDLTRELGGFWEEFDEYGGEDQELAWRLEQAGCTLWGDFESIAYHIDHPKRSLSGRHFKMIERSKALPTLVRNGGPIRACDAA